MTHRRKMLTVTAAVLLVLAASAFRSTLDMVVSTAPEGTTVIIPPRATLREVAAILTQAKILHRPKLFILWAKLLNLEKSIRYGEYSFSGPQSIKRVMDTLVSGRTILHKLTIPEGLTLRQIAAAVETTGLGKAAEIITAAASPDLLYKLGIPGNNIEGFCFPDTYNIPRDWPANRILETMVVRFWEVFDGNLRRRCQEMGLSVLQAVTLASIIEKESGQGAELPIISAVFHNRLRKGIPLMADPVVIYGIADFDGNIRKSDLAQPGPYNVYLNTGLPPGPISNPGLPALRAALYPAEVDFLYFVSKNNGSHYFSRTLAEHNSAVNLYQRARN